MALIATVAVWVVAVGAAAAVGGHRLVGVTVAPVVYGAVLAAGVASVAAGRRPRAWSLPARQRPLARGVLVFGALYVFGSGGGLGTGLGTVPGAAGLLVAVAAVRWPEPAALRAAMALAALGLLAPGGSPTEAPLHLAVVTVAAAVALVATNRLSAASVPALGGPTAGVPGVVGAAGVAAPRRTAAEAAIVLAVLVAAALLSTVVDPPQRRSPPTAGEEPGRPEPQEPSPLAFAGTLDPRDPGTGGSGGDDLLLRVRAPRPDVWRALTYDAWDGRRWHRSTGLPTTVAAGARFVPVPGDPFRRGADDQSSQRVRVEASYAEVAVGAPQVQYFELPGGAAVSTDGSVRAVPALGRGATYEAHSMRVAATADELREAGAAVPWRDPGTYLDAGAVSPAARRLAAEVTAGAATDYDRVRALERWLDANVAVDDEAPALAAGTDPVDSLLFMRRTGSPTRLASALTLLARSVGVPARLATGFLPGERPLLGGDFVVRARHAHAWVEVPFPGLGWQRFDPTGRIARAEAQDSFLHRLQRLLARWWPVLVALALGAVAAVVRLLVLRRRRRRARPWASRCLARLDRLGADRGRPRRPSETPAEYTAALADGVVADERLRTVGALVTAAAWSGREPPEEARSWAEQVLEEAAAGRRGASAPAGG